jgi:hypothetical protein
MSVVEASALGQRMVVRGSARVAQLERSWIQVSSRLSVAQKASTAALSSASPVDPEDRAQLGPWPEALPPSFRRGECGVCTSA